MDTELLQRLRSLVCEHLDVRPEDVSETASFTEDLGADSLDLVELAMKIEEKFSLDIPDSDYVQFRTVGHALRYLEQRIAAQ